MTHNSNQPTLNESISDTEYNGKKEYRKYLQSNHWQQLKGRLTKQLKRLGQWECYVCERDGRLQLHHRTYTRKGCEIESDLVVLCTRCHLETHGLAEKHGLYNAHIRLLKKVNMSRFYEKSVIDEKKDKTIITVIPEREIETSTYASFYSPADMEYL